MSKEKETKTEQVASSAVETVVMCPICKETDLIDISLRQHNGLLGSGAKSWVVADFHKCPNCHIVLSKYGT